MTFQILSLSGGGFLGLYTISIIEKIEEQLGFPIARCFDLLAGTSIGGIIALGLAAEKPAKQIREAFEQNGSHIFSDRPVPQGSIRKKLDTGRFLMKPKYSAAEQQCWKHLEQDLESCAELGKRGGKEKYEVCRKTAMERYANCKANKDQVPPLGGFY